MEKTLDLKSFFIKLIRPQPEEQSAEDIINSSDLSKKDKAELIKALRDADDRLTKATAIPAKRKTKTIKTETVKVENKKADKAKNKELEKEPEKEIGD